ncbi:MAG: hypothetical protein M3N98_05855 [Actinomycetota bacterium]|nr:hypothetical protein [Actinomycetota bacterium]
MAISDRRRDVNEITPLESEFVDSLDANLANHLDVWLNESDGRPWLTVSIDVVRDGVIRATWRVDFDGESICGGRSPACLNWDDGVSADEARIDMKPPRGIPRTFGAAAELGAEAARWFIGVRDRMKAPIDFRPLPPDGRAMSGL